MRRVISVWLPHWPTDRLKRTLGSSAPPPETALVTATQDGNRRVIAAVNQAAQRLGLFPGIAVAQAAAVTPGLAIVKADPAEDAASLQRLARWCHRITPLTAPDPPDGLWLDVTGCTHLWDGERPLLDHLVTRLAQDGISARAAVADTPGTAHAVARHGTDPVVAPGMHSEAIAPLPVQALRLDDETVAILRRLGFEQVGHVARVPRALLARRFGPEPGRRLDQAHGVVPEPLQPLPPAAPLQHRMAFLEPLLTAEALSTATHALLASDRPDWNQSGRESAGQRYADPNRPDRSQDDFGVGPLCAAMERAGLGARRLDLLFERVDGAVQAIRVGTARPSRDAAHLARLLLEHLDRVDPGLGIEAMRLVVPLAEPLRWRQNETGGGGDVSTLVDRLANRLGADHVYRAAPVESDLPERAVGRIPALARPTGATWPGAAHAPTRLLDPPRKVDAIAALPDHPPAAFIWRRHRHRIRRADGPERLYGEWWRHDPETHAVRDYFRVEDEAGRRFLLYREGNGTDPATGALGWYVQGIF